MSQVLMPRATAVWLVENTTLTFEQIAEFCGMHPLEVQTIADGESGGNMVGVDPIANGQITQTELERCQADPKARLQLHKTNLPRATQRTKGPRYTPVAKRGDKPDAIAWLLKYAPEMTDNAICRLIGTTKPTIAAVRTKSHWNSQNIRPQNPVLLGLCRQEELNAALERVSQETGQPITIQEEELMESPVEPGLGRRQDPFGAFSSVVGELPASYPEDER